MVPDLAGRIDYVIAFCEAEPPYSVTPMRPNGAFQAMGESRWLRAVEIWERCLTNNEWPHYTDRIETLAPPGWALLEEEQHFEESL